MHLVGRRDHVPINMHEYNHCSLVYDIFDYTGFEPANFFFLSLYTRVLVNQFLFFFPHYFFSHFLYMDNPTWIWL